MGWKDGYNEYKVSPELLASSTYTIGDSFDYLRKKLDDKTLLSYDEVRNLTDEELAAHPNLADRKGGNYIEGQVWAPYMLKGNELVKKTAASVTGFNYTKDGKYPDNLLNYSDDKLKDVLKAIDRGRGYINKRKEREERLYRAAKKKVSGVMVKHPLYFRVGKDDGEWGGKGIKEYKLSKPLLQMSTYTIGDSLNTDTGDIKVYTYDDIKAMSDKEIQAILDKNEGDDGKYIEGQLWVNYKVLDGKIVEDKEMNEPMANEPKKEAHHNDDFYDKLNKMLEKYHGAPNKGQVGQLADNVLVETGPRVVPVMDKLRSAVPAASVAGLTVANTIGTDKEASIRDDYKLPGMPDDPVKMQNYIDTNKRLLKDNKLQPAIRDMLQKEIEATDAKFMQMEQMQQQQNMQVEQQQMGIDAQKADMAHQQTMRDIEIRKAKLDIDRTKIDNKSAEKDLTAPVKPAGKKKTAEFHEECEDRRKALQLRAKKLAEKTAGILSSGASGIESAINKTVSVAGPRIRQFAKNVGGRSDEIMHNTVEMAKAQGRASTTTGFAKEVNENLATDYGNKLKKVKYEVRKARVDGTLGVVGSAVGYEAYKDGYQDPYAYKLASDGVTHISLDRKEGMSADVLHAIDTITDDVSGAKKKLIAAAGVAAVSAGIAAYSASKLPPELLQHTAHQRTGIEMGKAIAQAIPMLGVGGGLYYAKQNGDNIMKRRLGLGVAGASAIPLGMQVFDNRVSQEVTKEMALKHLPFSVASTTAAGAIMYGAHKGQEMANQELIDNAMSSDAPLEDVAHVVNTIRERRTVNTRYPVMRYLPFNKSINKNFNAHFGKPAGALNADDMALYFEVQKEKELRRLVTRFESEHKSKPTQEELTEMRNEAHRLTTARL